MHCESFQCLLAASFFGSQALDDYFLDFLVQPGLHSEFLHHIPLRRKRGIILIIFVDLLFDVRRHHLHDSEVVAVEPKRMDAMEKLGLLLEQTAVLSLNDVAMCVLDIYLADEFAFFGCQELVACQLFRGEHQFLFVLLRQVEVLGPLELSTVFALVDSNLLFWTLSLCQRSLLLIPWLGSSWTPEYLLLI